MKKKNISQKDREAVREAIDRGYLVTLATGRMYRSALSYAQELGIKLPLVTYNGALVKDPSTERHWPIGPLPLKRQNALSGNCLIRISMFRLMSMIPFWFLLTVPRHSTMPSFPVFPLKLLVRACASWPRRPINCLSLMMTRNRFGGTL